MVNEVIFKQKRNKEFNIFYFELKKNQNQNEIHDKIDRFDNIQI